MDLIFNWEYLYYISKRDEEKSVIVLWNDLKTVTERFYYCQEKWLLKAEEKLQWLQNIDGLIRIGN